MPSFQKAQPEQPIGPSVEEIRDFFSMNELIVAENSSSIFDSYRGRFDMVENWQEKNLVANGITVERIAGLTDLFNSEFGVSLLPKQILSEALTTLVSMSRFSRYWGELDSVSLIVERLGYAEPIEDNAKAQLQTLMGHRTSIYNVQFNGVEQLFASTYHEGWETHWVNEYLDYSGNFAPFLENHPEEFGELLTAFIQRGLETTYLRQQSFQFTGEPTHGLAISGIEELLGEYQAEDSPSLTKEREILALIEYEPVEGTRHVFRFGENDPSIEQTYRGKLVSSQEARDRFGLHVLDRFDDQSAGEGISSDWEMSLLQAMLADPVLRDFVALFNELSEEIQKAAYSSIANLIFHLSANGSPPQISREAFDAILTSDLAPFKEDSENVKLVQQCNPHLLTYAVPTDDSGNTHHGMHAIATLYAIWAYDARSGSVPKG